jgi:hypothetical protein
MIDLNKTRRTVLAKKEKEADNPIYFDTGHLLLNLVTGAGEKAGYGMGIMASTIYRDHGPSGASKSFKATELIAANYYKYKDKFKWRYVDVENGNTIDTEALYGFDMMPPPSKNERPVITAEDWDYDLNKWLETLHPEDGECGVYVLDSLDSLSSNDTEERKEDRRKAYDRGKEFSDGTYGMGQAKFLSQEFFRGLTAKLKAKNAMLYIISQERESVNAGLYGPKWTVGGGKAVSFYESVRIRSVLKQKEEKEGRVVSVVVQVTAEKVRNPRPFRSCFVTIHFTHGLDSFGDEIDFLFDLRSEKTGELLKRASAIIWDDGMEPMSKEELIKYISENKLRKELKKRVIDKWNAIEDSIVVQRPNKFEDEE